MQVASSNEEPLQGLPPLLGGTHVRSLDIEPLLHVTLHLDQALQGSQYPSVGLHRSQNFGQICAAWMMSLQMSNSELSCTQSTLWSFSHSPDPKACAPAVQRCKLHSSCPQHWLHSTSRITALPIMEKGELVVVATLHICACRHPSVYLFWLPESVVSV